VADAAAHSAQVQCDEVYCG